VVRDVGRVLGYPYGFVDQIAKLIPFELNITLEGALAAEPALKERYEREEDVRGLIDLAQKLEGLVRNAGKHAGGVVIAPAPLTEFTPLYCEQGSESPVSQFDMGDVEAIGLVKFDFLGLRTLTIIDWALRDINRSREAAGEAPIDITRIPLDDHQTFELIRRAETTAVFQLESRGFKELIKRLQPDVFEDLIALVALFRPGPLQSGMVDDFINRKHGRVRIEYPHPDLEAILKPTYGVIVYQEQVMQIAQVLAGYSLGAADLLRRAMGKKKPEEMAKQRAIFVDGAVGRGVKAELAAGIFDLMEKFAGYGFNKSHSAAYALIAYQTAWLKAHNPAAFMAAVLSADMDNTDKVVGLIDECRRMRLKVLPPDVNTCAYGFTVADPESIRYGLGAVKGVGRAAIETVATERAARGASRDLYELCKRVDARKLNRRALEALIRAGAMDALGPGRSVLMANLDRALQMAEQHHRNAIAGQVDLFGLEPAARADDAAAVDFISAPAWSDQERLAGEKETLGLFLTGHPIDRHARELSALAVCPLAELKLGSRRVAGLVVGIRITNSRRGRMAIATLDDRTARVEVVAYAEVFLKYQQVLVKDRIVIVEGACAVDEFSGGFSLTAEVVMELDAAREAYAKKLILSVTPRQVGNGLIPALQQALIAYRPGACPVVIDYARADACARLVLADAWRVKPTESLLDRLKAIAGEEGVHDEY
jgi:DNA polymerase-3 subunit alpha